MALVVKDRVKQTTTTTGTGSIVLNGNVSGFQTFAAALTDGDTTYYGIFEPSTNEYEVGLGTWTESTATLARTTILESSNSGSAVSLTAQAEVFITQPAEKAVFQDSNGDVDLGGNKILFGNLYSTTGDLPNASTYHGMFAHVHGTGKAYYAHGGNWIELVNEDTSGNVSMGGNLTVTGDLTVNGTTTTVNTTNTVVTDSLIELANGTTGSPSNDAGIVIERGDSNNAFIGYDESADKFTVGTGSFTGASTGNLTITTGTLVANVEGNVTGNVTGDVTGDVTGNVTGNLTGTASSATNADTVDSLHASSFLRSDADDTTTGTLTIDNSTQTSFNVEYANDGTGVGPLLRTFRDSASPAANDLIGGIDFKGNDSGGSETFYARIMGRIIDSTDGSEDGAVEINVAKAGTAAWETSGLVAKFDASGMELRGDIIFEGSTANNSETTLTVTDPTADRTITLPDATGTVWTSGNDGSGSGLDADLWDGNQFSSYLNQAVLTSSSPTFSNAYLAGLLYHEGDTDTNLSFGTNTITLNVGGTPEVTINSTGVRLGDTGNGYFQPVTGNYGSIQIDGGAHGGYEGYNIGGRAAFLHDNSVTTGISDDVNNQWLINFSHGGAANIYYNGTSKISTTSSGANINGDLNAVDNIYLASTIYHEGDTDTYIDFDINQINFVTGGATEMQINGDGVFLNGAALHEEYVALSGTTPTCDPNSGGGFSLTLSGNTTFTFGGTTASWSTGFIVELTGHASSTYTVTWPSSVDWAGGTAPDAPGTGETDIYAFWTRDGGTTWYGIQSIDAAA